MRQYWELSFELIILIPLGELKDPTFLLRSDLRKISKSTENSFKTSQVIYGSKE